MSEFRAHLTTLSLGEDYAAAVARILLSLPSVEPTRLAVASMTVAGKTWLAAEWIETWNSFTGEYLSLGRWYQPPLFVPTPKEVKPRVHKPKPGRNLFIYRAEGSPFVNVSLTPSGKFKARFGNKNKTYSTALEAASASDSYRRARGGGLLNFRTEIDSRSATTFVLKEAA